MPPINWATLIATLRDTDDFERSLQACEVISEVADESCVPDLYALLNDEDIFVREAAAAPLATLEGIKALPALFQALTRGFQDGHDNDGLSTTIIGILGNQKSAVVPLLLKMADAPNSETRSNAAWALGFVAEAITSLPLLTLLHDNDAAVRASAAGSLGSFKNDLLVIDELLKAMQDSNEQVCVSVISALGYLGDERTIEPLHSALKDSRSRVRWQAGDALKHLKAL